MREKKIRLVNGHATVKFRFGPNPNFATACPALKLLPTSSAHSVCAAIRQNCHLSADKHTTLISLFDCKLAIYAIRIGSDTINHLGKVEQVEGEGSVV